MKEGVVAQMFSTSLFGRKTKAEILRDAAVMEMEMKMRGCSPTAREGFFQMHGISE